MVESVTSERAHPQRPTWNPAEEARTRAAAEQRALEMAEAAAAGKGRRGAAPFQPGPGPMPQVATQSPAALRHTTLPRMLVSFAPIIGMVGIVFAVLLKQRGYITETSSFSGGERVTEYHLDPKMNNLAIGIAFLVFAMPIFAWGWWVVAATLNAQAKSRKSGWPWTLPTSVLVAVAAVLAANFVPEGPRPILYIVFAIAYVWGAYGVLFSLRKSARAIKADPVFWSRLIWIPWLSGLASAATFTLGAAVGSPEIAVFGSLIPLGLWLWAWLTLVQGMASFDRSCRANEVARTDSDSLPAFMTNRALR